MTTTTGASATRRHHPVLTLLSSGSMIAATLYVVLTTTTLPDAAPIAPARSTLEWWVATPIEHVLGGAARLVLIATLGYLALVATTQLVALVAPGTKLARAVDRVAPRALALATAGLIITSGSTAAASPAPTTTSPGGDQGGVTMQILSPSSPRPGSPAAEPRTSIPRPPTTIAPADPVPTADPVRSVDPSTAVPSPSVTPLRYVVQRGDHLWSIAERAVSLDGMTADASVVDRYWRALIDTNRDRLIDPGDPDLILPGQELELPSISGRGAR